MTESIPSHLYGANASESEQRAALTGGSIPVAVYGLGKMGLPLACVYAERTGAVTGVDVDPTVVERIEDGDCHVTGEPGLKSLVSEQVSRGRLSATTDGVAAAESAAIHVVIVPTLLDDEHNPDLTTVESVTDAIAAGLSPGDLVVAESTLPPGSCRELILEHLVAKSGLEHGTFGVAFCPERTSSGTALRDIRGRYPKVVGGVDDESARAAALVYGELTDAGVHVVSNATTAEAVKVFEGIYRDVNIALANELGRTADDLGISVREAIATANALPMCHIHDPGPGVGGHCIPVYPHFLFARTSESTPLTRTARTVNDEMPAYVASRLFDLLEARDVSPSDASVLVLGFTYRAGVEETRHSPAIGLVESLTADQPDLDVSGVDPLVDPGAYGVTPLELGAVTDESFDAAVLVTAHDEFDGIDWTAFDPMIVLDTRDALDIDDTHHDVYTLAGVRWTPRTVDSGSGESGSDSDFEATDSELTPQFRTDGGDSAVGGGPSDRCADVDEPDHQQFHRGSNSDSASKPNLERSGGGG